MRRFGIALTVAAALAAAACGRKGNNESAATRADVDSPAPAETAPARPSAASTAAAESDREGASDSVPRDLGPPLWRVSRAGTSSYLFGTVHGGIAPDELASSVWTAFAASKTLVTESDIANGNADELLALATLEAEPGLRERLTPDRWKAARALLPDLAPEALDRLEPWYVTVVASARMLPPGESMDAALSRRARAANKRVVHLEPWRDQIAAIEGATGLAELEALLDDPVAARANLARLVELYRRGDVAAIRELVEATARDAGNPGAVALLVDGRNRAWLDDLAEALGRGDAFAAVGAAHLAGDAGLLELLSARGFDVERVDAPTP